MAFFMKLEGLQPPQEFIEKQGYKKIQSYRLTEYQQPKKPNRSRDKGVKENEKTIFDSS
jgi:hypothetical protein